MPWTPRARHAALGALPWLLPGLLALHGCDAGPRDPSQVQSSLTDKLNRGEHAAAVIELKALVQAQPEAAFARALLGQTLLEVGDAPGAVVELERALQGQHPQEQVVPWLARALLLSARGAEAIQRFADTRLAAGTAAADLAVTLAQARQSQGQAAAALEALQPAAQAHPEHVGLQVMQARLLADLNRTDEARALAQALVQRFPDEAEVWLLHADERASAGDLGAAQAGLERALQLDPRFSAAHAAGVQLALTAGRLDTARERLAAMERARPGVAQASLLRARLAWAENRPEQTRALLQPLVAGAGASPAVLRLAAAAEQRLGSLELAQALLVRVLAITPRDAAVSRELASVLMQLGRADRALEQLAPLIEDGRADAATWLVVGQAQSQLGRFQAAADSFRRARQGGSQDLRLQAEMARTLFAQGQADAAVRSLEQAARGQDGAAASAELVAAHMRAGDTAAALQAAERLVVQRPQAALAEVLRGHVLEARGERAASRGAYEAALAKEPGFFAAVASLAELDRREGKMADGRARFEAFLRSNPGAAPALLALARLDASQGASSAAVRAALDKAVAARPQDGATWLAALEIEKGLREPLAALALARRAVEALPNSPELLQALALAQRQAGEPAEALRTQRRAVSAQPGAVSPRLLLAEALLAAGDLPGAQRQVEDALAVDADSFAARRAQVLLQLQAGRPDAALESAAALVKRLPDHAGALRLQAEVLSARRDHAGAAKAWRQALALGPDGLTAQRLSSSLRAAGDAAAAQRFEREWRSRAPEDLDFMAHLAQQADLRGDRREAIALYRQIVERVPDAALALNNLAVLLLADAPREALAMAERAVSLAPGLAPLIDTLAQAQLANQQLERALASQNAALRLDPGSGDFRFTLARIHAAAGRRDEALAELRRLAARGADYPKQAEVAKLLASLGAPG